MPKNILVLSASVGAGHMRAAQAVELALREIAPDAQVENVDVLTLTNSMFRRLYGSAYLDLVNKAPHVLGYFYDMMDRPRRPRSRRDRLRRAVEKLNLRKLEAFLLDRLWDDQPCDRFTTATDEGKAYLAHWGVPAEAITVTGIPIHPVFAHEKPR